MTLLSFVCWLHPAMPAQKKRPKKKIGQAPALSRPLWKEWVKFIASECGARIAVVLSFTGFFGLSCSEALCLEKGRYQCERWNSKRSFYQVRLKATRNHLVRSTSGSLIWLGWNLWWKMDSMCSASGSTGMDHVTSRTHMKFLKVVSYLLPGRGPRKSTCTTTPSMLMWKDKLHVFWTIWKNLARSGALRWPNCDHTVAGLHWSLSSWVKDWAQHCPWSMRAWP